MHNSNQAFDTLRAMHMNRIIRTNQLGLKSQGAWLWRGYSIFNS